MMKLAKIYSALIAICFLTSLCLAQDTPPPGMSEKETKKWIKQQKASKKIQEKARKKEEEARKKEEKKPKPPEYFAPATLPFDITAKAETVALFFNDYLGKTVKFESVGIYQLEAVTGTNEEMYGIDVSSKERYSKYTSPSNKLNFIMTNHLAREVTAEQESFLKAFPSGTVLRNVNIFANMRRGKDSSKIAYILCMEFVTRNDDITKQIGNCQ
jgi:hypothetical protein